MKKSMKAVAFAGAMALASLFSSSAQANTISFYNDAATLDTLRFTLSCSLGCTAWTGPANTFSSTVGDLFTLANQGDAFEIAAINTKAGTSFDSSTFVKTPGSGEAFSFISNSLYLLIKIGKSPDIAVIMSNGLGNAFDFLATKGTGSGFSHVSGLGTAPDISPDPVPLPAPLLLLLSGLGGLGLLGRMRRKTA